MQAIAYLIAALAVQGTLGSLTGLDTQDTPQAADAVPLDPLVVSATDAFSMVSMNTCTPTARSTAFTAPDLLAIGLSGECCACGNPHAKWYEKEFWTVKPCTCPEGGCDGAGGCECDTDSDGDCHCGCADGGSCATADDEPCYKCLLQTLGDVEVDPEVLELMEQSAGDRPLLDYSQLG